MSDADTVVLRFGDRRRERTRLVGLDAPEDHQSEKLDRDVKRSGRDREQILALGRRASAFTTSVLASGTTVEVERDVQERDRHGRLLAYVWRDRELLNLVILREGYAQVLTVPPNVKYRSVLLACQREAREAGRGLWRQ